MCSAHAVDAWLKVGLIDTRVVSIAPTVLGMQLSEFNARLLHRHARIAASRRYCDALQQLRPRDHMRPFVLHAAWNAPATARAKQSFLRRTAMFINANGSCNLAGPQHAICAKRFDCYGSDSYCSLPARARGL